MRAGDVLQRKEEDLGLNPGYTSILWMDRVGAASKEIWEGAASEKKEN